jgi:uncharacterized protein YidB (DUF937 family)
MGLFDGIMGGLAGAGVSALVGNLLEKNGGVQGLISNFEKNGLGSVVQSWVSTGENHAIEPVHVEQALGAETLQDLAAKTGMSVDELKAQLAKLLPDAVDKMTPNGTVAEAA